MKCFRPMYSRLKKSPRKKYITTYTTFIMVHGYNIDQDIIRSYCLNTIGGITPTLEFEPWKITPTNNSQL